MNTDFLGLILTDRTEIEMNFLEWRTAINGTDGNSNMQLIDGAISRLNAAIGGKADGFSFNPETGVLQLTSNGKTISGASVTINLNNYYTKEELDGVLAEMEESFANNETLQNIYTSAVGGLEWDEDSRALTLYNLNGEQVGDTITIEGGGGGSGSGTDYSIRIVNGMSSSTLTTATSTKTILTATFFEYYGSDATGVAGSLEVLYKLSTDEEWITYSTQSVAQGIPFSIDVTDILTKDKATNIKFSITGGESELVRSLTYTITQVEASIAAISFDTAAVYTGNIDFKYRCVGRNLAKTVHFEIDGVSRAEVDVGTSHNTTLTQVLELVGNCEYGAHDLVVYFTTSDGAKSNVLKYTILYNDGSKTEPMVGIILSAGEVTYGDTINIDYVVYTPNQETTDSLTISVYSKDDSEERIQYVSQTLENIPNNILYNWQGSIYPESGIAYIEFKSGATVKTVSIFVNEIQSGYDLNPVATNLVYRYSAAGRSNNDSNKDEYYCEYKTVNGITTHVKSVFNGFNWVSNGYVDGESLTLSGAALHTIKLPMFATSYTDDDGQTVNLESATGATVTTNGRTFEIEFMVSNVTDLNAQIIKCMSEDHSGFIVTPQNCYMIFSNGADVALDDTGFIENEESVAAAYIKDNKRIRLAFVVEPKGSVHYSLNDGTSVSGQCLNIYINGQFANSFPYPDNARFAQTEFITIGDGSCITNIYDVRIYNRGLSATEIMQNYKASPLSVQDRILRFEDNDVLTDDGDVDYYKAIEKYPCLLITGSLSPYKGANGVKTEGKIESGVTLTKPDGRGGHTTEFDLLDKDSDGIWVSANNVQGTSSVKFPVKNYKIYLAKLGTDDLGQSVKQKVKYSLKGKDADTGKDLSIGESTLCWKGDYMSSDHANTYNANLADTLFNDTLDSQNPSKGGDSRVQNTVYGFRCLLFRRDDIGSDIEFAGDGALNNDKGNTKTFGLECDGDSGNDTKRQKWEFKNNTEALCSFQTDRFYELIDGKKRVLSGLESTYPDQGDLEDAGLEPNYDHIQVLFTWVYQRANFWDASDNALETPRSYNGIQYTTERDYRKAIFINEFDKHFNRNHAIVYYLFNEFVALCDNRAKNLFIRCEDVKNESLVSTSGSAMSINDAIDMSTGEVNADMIDWEKSTFAVWITDLYDLDSCFGVENSGYLQIPYYADWNYHLNGTQKFNGRESRLWLMIEEALASDIQKKAQELTDKSSGNGGLNYETLYDYHIKNNAMMVCPAVVNRDMEHKYSDPWTEGYVDYSSEGQPIRHISDYKYLQRGSRTEQKDSFMYKRSNLMYSKYKCNKFVNNNINFRVGTNGGVPAKDSSITITASQAIYPAVKYGDGDAALISADKTAAGVSVTITKPGTTTSDKVGFSDTVYIAGGTMLTDIGDISKFRPYELQLQNATGLKKLIIGSSDDGYTNAQLKNIDTSGCKILEELNIMGCTALTGSIDLSKNGIIKKVFAGGSSASSIVLPNGGVLEELHLGAVSDIEILNQSNLSIYDCSSYSKLSSLRVENTSIVPTLEIVKERLPYLTGGLRLVGIDEIIDDNSVLEMLLSDDAKGKYIDNNGVLSEDRNAYPYISGTIHCGTVGSYFVNQLKQAYPYLNIDAKSIIDQFVVTFCNYDGTVLNRQYIFRNENAVDPIEAGYIETPIRENSVSTIYTFAEWDRTFTAITQDVIVYATYSETLRTFTVKWYNGDQLLKTAIVNYGEDAEYDGEIPTDTSLESYGIYCLFNGWDCHTGCVCSDVIAKAKFTQASAPTDKALSEMTPVELYALVRDGIFTPLGDKNTIISSGDTIDLQFGDDYEFSNIESTEIVEYGNTLELDGTNYLDTGIKLLENDEPFTLVLDYKLGNPSTTSEQWFASCYDKGGFKLTIPKASGNYSNVSPQIMWGSSKSTAVNGSTYIASNTTNGNIHNKKRDILVVRKKANDSNLYVYSYWGGLYVGDSKFTTITSSVFTPNEASLILGAKVDADGYVDCYSKASIYWAKLWKADLGESTCKKIAGIPRKKIEMKASGNSEHTFRLFKRSDSDTWANCVFLLSFHMGDEILHTMNPTATNIGGWAESTMRTWLNTTIYNMLPLQWKLLIQKVKVVSNAGGGEETTVTSDDYLWIPSCTEVGVLTDDGFYLAENDTSINYCVNYRYHPTYTWYRSPAKNSTGFRVRESDYGAITFESANIEEKVRFGFCI